MLLFIVFLNIFKKNLYFYTCKSNNYEINDNVTKTKKATISGISFSYKDAPESVKSDYLKNARALGVQVTNDSNIFIPDFDISKYNLSKSDSQKAAVESWAIQDYGSYFISTELYTGRQYTVSKSALVGYNHVTSGNPVHLTQLFLNIFAYKYPRHNSVTVDSIFGIQPMTQFFHFNNSLDCQMMLQLAPILGMHFHPIAFIEAEIICHICHKKLSKR
ncbi:hypothetical protein ACYUJ6_13795 [Clostridium sp. JNZ X4-2]|jgi:hypothetical protein|uniref:Putative peptidoglycan-binding domain-containing protein n=1 Tax=Clostridium luticellarii TaxID=1691940 RepID=A0A2T0B4N1_9CLOT|nr:hypothetical protein [Clostridium luticellarii]PRR78839.1 hypothetical protein CLLU_35900 [Clostridium luticellarii]